MRLRPSLWLACAAVFAACAEDVPQVDRVFLVTIDTLRADHLGCYGYPRDVSPFLDELAAGGILFEKAYSSSSHTAPSHASMFTGLYPKQHGVLHNRAKLPPQARTLAHHLGAAGFETAGFSAVRFLIGLESGFDHFETNRSRPRRKIYQSARIGVDKALEWIGARSPSDRYFVWLHLFDTHEWHRLAERPGAAAARPSELAGDELLGYLMREHGLRSIAGFRGEPLAAVDRYDSQIVRVDRHLRRFHETLEARGDLEDSVFIVTADHGEGLGSHQIAGHGRHLYEEQIRVPLIFSFGDGRWAARRRDEQVRHVDLLPTLADLTGFELGQTGPALAGRSLLRLLSGRPDDGPRPAFAQRRPADSLRLDQGWTPGDVVSLQLGAFKYIYRTEGRDELYDLSADPLEQDNLAGEPPLEGKRLREALMRMNDEMVEQAAESHLLDDSHRDALRALGYLQ